MVHSAPFHQRQMKFPQRFDSRKQGNSLALLTAMPVKNYFAVFAIMGLQPTQQPSAVIAVDSPHLWRMGSLVRICVSYWAGLNYMQELH